MILVVLGLCDARAGRLPNQLNALLALVGTVHVWSFMPEQLPASAGGAALGYAIVALVAAYGRWRAGAPGIGMGDAKLLSAGGVWVGVGGVAMVLLIASCSALASLLAGGPGVREDIDGRGRRGIAFGPYLCFGIFATHLWQTFGDIPWL